MIACPVCRQEYRVESLVELVKAECPSCGTALLCHYAKCRADLGALLLQQELVTPEQLEAIRATRQHPIDAALELGFVQSHQLTHVCLLLLPHPLSRRLAAEGILEVDDNPHPEFIRHVVQAHLVSKEIGWWNPAAQPVLPEAVARVPAHLARAYRFMPVSFDGALTIAVSRLLAPATLDELKAALRCEIRQLFAPEELIRQMLDRFYPKTS